MNEMEISFWVLEKNVKRKCRTSGRVFTSQLEVAGSNPIPDEWSNNLRSWTS